MTERPLRESADEAFERAYAIHREGRAKEAIAAYSEVLEIDPEHGPTLITLNRLEDRLKQPRTQATTDRGRALQASLAAIESAPHLNEDERKFFLGYHGKVERLRRSPYMTFPMVIHIETLASCNAACVFCPYPTMDRIGERMSDDLFEKILDDLSAIPADLPVTVCPFKLSDPLLEKRLF